MSLGGLSPIDSAAGVPLPQAKGAEIGRMQTESAAESRELHSDTLAESASGVGQTDGQDLASGQRDADGRRPWEFLNSGEIAESKNNPSKPTDSDKGNLLDLIA